VSVGLLAIYFGGAGTEVDLKTNSKIQPQDSTTTPRPRFWTAKPGAPCNGFLFCNVLRASGGGPGGRA